MKEKLSRSDKRPGAENISIPFETCGGEELSLN